MEETPDPVKTAAVRDSIRIVFEGEPQPDWFPLYRDVAVYGRSLFVAASGGISQEAADAMCNDISNVLFDDDAQPIGITGVHIQVGEDVVADCDARQ